MNEFVDIKNKFNIVNIKFFANKRKLDNFVIIKFNFNNNFIIKNFDYFNLIIIFVIIFRKFNTKIIIYLNLNK